MPLAAALLTFSLAAADARQSVRAQELNPIMRPFVSTPAATYAVKLGSAGLTTWIVEHERHQGRTKTAWLLWWGVNVAQAAVVLHNAHR